MSSANPLLSDLLAAFGTLPPKEKKAKGSRAASSERRTSPDLPLPQSFSKRKTGYQTWKATSRVLQVQKQICKCCGGEIEAIKAEYFALENGQAHATWLRAEGYGIVAPEDLPNTFVDLEPMYVTACAECRSTPFDDLFSIFQPKQLSLEL